MDYPTLPKASIGHPLEGPGTVMVFLTGHPSRELGNNRKTWSYLTSLNPNFARGTPAAMRAEIDILPLPGQPDKLWSKRATNRMTANATPWLYVLNSMVVC